MDKRATFDTSVFKRGREEGEGRRKGKAKGKARQTFLLT